MLILRALYSLSIVEVAISVCNFDIQKTGQDWMNIMNPVRLLTQLARVLFVFETPNPCKISIDITVDLNVLVLLGVKY
jgi:hypothetical protein